MVDLYQFRDLHYIDNVGPFFRKFNQYETVININDAQIDFV